MERPNRGAWCCLLLPFLIGAPAMSLAQDAGAPSLGKHVQPIFDANCVACHQTGAAQQGLILESGLAYANVGRSSTEAAMTLIEPGKPEASYLFLKVSGTYAQASGKGARMPLGGVLEGADIETIRRWIVGGAKNN